TDFVGDRERPFWELSREALVMEGTFQSPVTSWLYERGWRNAFKQNGFPGVDNEFVEATTFFADVADGGVVVDLSCGSGLMTRRLVRSRRYSRVIGVDLSAPMLGETALRFRREGLQQPELLRANVGRLPLQTGVVNAVHAGAALHCWMDLERALLEVHFLL
ncbi:unnamed protein product, partial [Phaeothamnion confervicola]